MNKSPSIVVVENDRDRALMIVDGLRDAGSFQVSVVTAETGLARKISERSPDFVLIDAHTPTSDVLKDLAFATGPLDRPVVMFVDTTDATLTKLAIETGLSAYVVGGLQKDRIKPILDAAAARFQMMQTMRAELADTRRALQERKVIERAKSILMQARAISEDQAHALLRKSAMDQGKKMAELALALVLAQDLLK